MSIFKWSHAGIFAGGMLFATKGIELIKSKKTHECLVKATAFVLRGRDEVMENVTQVREGCEDIYAEAEALNEEKAAAPSVEVKVIEDKSKAKETTKKKTSKATGKRTK